MSARTSAVVRQMDLADSLLHDPVIKEFVAQNRNLESAVREATQHLLQEHPNAPREELVTTLRRLQGPLASNKLKVFFSFKKKDESIANVIASRLKEWSADKLVIEGMERFAVEQPGRDFRKKIFDTISSCDWFLLLLPAPGEQGDERDWVLLEAGYYLRGQDLGSRLVCLHHPDNEMVNALGDLQSVPAERDAVKKFLIGLFQKPNWIPGIPALNANLENLNAKTKEIVELIQPPVVRSCCGPHMEVRFDDASAVKGWKQLAAGLVTESNEECRRLFGLIDNKPTFGDWFRKAQGARKNQGWVMDLARAVKAVGDGVDVPPLRSSIGLREHYYVRPIICAVKRRTKDRRVEAVNFLFSATDLPPETSTMKPALAALAITLQFAVRFRYQLLQEYAGRQIEAQDVQAFNSRLNQLRREAAADPRFGDPKSLQAKVVSLFKGEDRTVVEKMYERSDQMWRRDGEGEMDKAIAKLDGATVAQLIRELLDMVQDFLTVTAKRFAELIAQA